MCSALHWQVARKYRLASHVMSPGEGRTGGRPPGPLRKSVTIWSDCPTLARSSNIAPKFPFAPSKPVKNPIENIAPKARYARNATSKANHSELTAKPTRRGNASRSTTRRRARRRACIAIACRAPCPTHRGARPCVWRLAPAAGEAAGARVRCSLTP